jgi:hypothetical protein
MKLDREQFLAAAIAIGAATGCNLIKDGTDTAQATQVTPETPPGAAPGAAQPPGAAGEEPGAGEGVARDHAGDVRPGSGTNAAKSSALRSPTQEAGIAPTKEIGLVAPTKEIGQVSPTKELGKVAPTKEYGTKPITPTAEIAKKP